MKKTLVGLFPSLPVALMLLCAPPLASDSDARSYPHGDYKNSCRDINVIGDVLEAECQRKDGKWEDTHLYYKSCDGSISNDDGDLVCDKDQHAKWDPPGSYQQSCKDASVEKDELEAQCKGKDGSWNWSSLNFKKCYDDISNDDGKLVCGRRHHHAQLPHGSYQDSCKHIEIDGNTLHAECKDTRGKWRDSSLDVKGCRGDVNNIDGRLTCQ